MIIMILKAFLSEGCHCFSCGPSLWSSQTCVLGSTCDTPEIIPLNTPPRSGIEFPLISGKHALQDWVERSGRLGDQSTKWYYFFTRHPWKERSGSLTTNKMRSGIIDNRCRGGKLPRNVFFFFFSFSHFLSVHGWTSAFLLDVHKLCGAIEGRLSHFPPRWLRTGWHSVIRQGKIPWNTPPQLGIESGPQEGQTVRLIHFLT